MVGFQGYLSPVSPKGVGECVPGLLPWETYDLLTEGTGKDGTDTRLGMSSQHHLSSSLVTFSYSRLIVCPNPPLLVCLLSHFLASVAGEATQGCSWKLKRVPVFTTGQATAATDRNNPPLTSSLGGRVHINDSIFGNKSLSTYGIEEACYPKMGLMVKSGK